MTVKLPQKPLVSVVIPAIDQIELLKANLKHLINQSWENMEIIVVDDKSKRGCLIQKACKDYHAKYIRNFSDSNNSQRALARNIGLSNSTGDLIVFLDMDIILSNDSIEKHVSLHRSLDNIVVCSQIWNINRGSNIEELGFTEDKLKSISQCFIHDSTIHWSSVTEIKRTKNWWCFLSANCSFKRQDIIQINSWDSNFEGWGGEDTEIGYRIALNGLDIIYTDYIKAFHVSRDLTPKERVSRYEAVLINIDYMCKKYPELTTYDRLILQRNNIMSLLRNERRVVTRARRRIGSLVQHLRKKQLHT